MKKSCADCLWQGNCNYSRPCSYYCPVDYEERFAEQAEAYRRERFDEEWAAYAEEWGEDNFF